jgi:hypothetical protein
VWLCNRSNSSVTTVNSYGPGQLNTNTNRTPDSRVPVFVVVTFVTIIFVLAYIYSQSTKN